MKKNFSSSYVLYVFLVDSLGKKGCMASNIQSPPKFLPSDYQETYVKSIHHLLS